MRPLLNWLTLLLLASQTGCLDESDTLDASQTVFGEPTMKSQSSQPREEPRGEGHAGWPMEQEVEREMPDADMTSNERLLAGTVVIHAIKSGGDGKQGSGFVINANQVVTNHHVIENGGRVVVIDSRGNEINGRVTRRSEQNDLAVIEGNFSGIPALSLSPKEPSVGDAIWVAGAPKGLQGTLSTGIVSAFRDASYLGFKSYQINAAISPGSSGGPVMNENGEIVGVSVASFTEGQALNFAIPSYYVEELLNP